MITKFPGLIDIHVHLRDMGQEHKEDFYTGTSAALAGGFTTVLDMPNNLQPITSLQRLQEKIFTASTKTVCDIGFHFGTLGDNFEEFEKVKGLVFGLKVYLDVTTGHFIIDEAKLDKVFEAWPGDTPILAHAEGPMVTLMAKMVRKHGKKAHIVHVSSKEELETIMAAKKEGLQLTCGVCMHHLYLTKEDEKKLGAYGLMKPSLKTQEDIDFLWQHIDSIDVIESDHAPHTKEEKDSDNPPFGIPGLETTLPLLLRAEADGKITREKIIDMCHTAPARIFEIPVDENTFIEVDESEEYFIKNEELHTKCSWTPFSDIKMKGKVVSVTLRGKEVYKNGKILAERGTGFAIVPGL